MRARSAVLDSTNMQGGRFEIDLAPLQVAQLRRPQTVPVSDQDHRRVPVAVDLTLGKVLASTKLGILAPARCNCSIYSAR